MFPPVCPATRGRAWAWAWAAAPRFREGPDPSRPLVAGHRGPRLRRGALRSGAAQAGTGDCVCRWSVRAVPAGRGQPWLCPSALAAQPAPSPGGFRSQAASVPCFPQLRASGHQESKLRSSGPKWHSQDACMWDELEAQGVPFSRVQTALVSAVFPQAPRDIVVATVACR